VSRSAGYRIDLPERAGAGDDVTGQRIGWQVWRDGGMIESGAVLPEAVFVCRRIADE
jgi:hypothetical protein